VLHIHRERAFPWGYGHMLIFGSIAATGAGLHVAAAYIGHTAHIGVTVTVMTVAAPVGVYAFTLFALYTYLVRSGDPFHGALLAGTAAILALAVLLASVGLPMAVCLVVLMLSPLVTIVGYETVGHRHLSATLNRALAG
jgi:low temperature requirement protein LtrA